MQALLYLEALSQKGAASGGRELELSGSCPSIQLSSSLRQKEGWGGSVSDGWYGHRQVGSWLLMRGDED